MYLTQLGDRAVVFTAEPTPQDIHRAYGENADFDKLVISPVEVINNCVEARWH